MSNDNLEENLKTKSEGESLFQTLRKIRAKAEPLLSKIGETFPDYTNHDINHSERVIKNLNLLIPNSLKNKLNAYEVYFIVASAYLHDIGMVDFPELKKGGKDAQQIRNEHHLRSEDFIVKNFKDLAIEDEHQAMIIGRICRGHRKEDLHNKDLFNPIKYINNIQ